MTGAFASRITRAPDPFEPERGREAADLYPGLPTELREVIAGAGGCSPYLKALLERERGWAEAALTGAPEAALEGALAEAAALPPTDLAPGLRRAKRRIALLTALADLAGVWPLEEVTGALTRFADLATHRALTAAVGHEIMRNKLPGDDDAQDGAGLVALAMGKMGANELNYSSDIDLICLFDESRFARDDFLEARAAFVRATRKMAATLSDITAEGYVFRTDLRLRPDPAVTPVALAMEAAERYYESLGRTWERAAYIKARAAAGDVAAGEAFLERLTPFVWRKHLDYAAIQDAHGMRQKIREHKALHSRKLEGFHLKLGSGGIREIEFFTQTRQIIAGGRDPNLRVRGTVEGLRALAKAGWADEAEDLIEDYRAHRELEHRVQMIADQQTHSLPNSEEGFARLAAFTGQSVADLRKGVEARIARVAAITEDFFAPAAARSAPDLSDQSAEIVARWPSYPALRSARAVEIFGRVQPELLARLARAARPDEALTHIDGFLRGLPAGVQLFSMFEANPQLIDLIVDIAATAPELASYLSRHADVFDAVIGGGFFAPWPGRAALEAEFSARLASAPDYEAKLSAARRWKNEWHFRVGVHHLRGLIEGVVAGQQYSDLASAVLAALWPEVCAEFAGKHGELPGRGAAILGMGSLGAERLTARSDLDLIVIYDPAGAEMSAGRRPLAARAYYARLTQAFVTAVTAPLGEGRLYEADMRLRPSGRQGPVATSLAAFTSYQTTEAWTWEHLALTRARPVAGSLELGEEIEHFRRALLARPRDRAETLADVAAMRARLAAAKPGGRVFDVKDGAGRLQDIALVAQAAALLAGSSARGVPQQLAASGKALGLTGSESEALAAAWALFWSGQAALRAITGGAFDPEAAGAGGRAFILRETGAVDIPALERILAETAGAAAAIIEAHLPAPEEAKDERQSRDSRRS